MTHTFVPSEMFDQGKPFNVTVNELEDGNFKATSPTYPKLEPVIDRTSQAAGSRMKQAIQQVQREETAKTLGKRRQR